MTLSLDDVRNKRFRMARKSGYEVLEVDEFVDEVEVAFEQLTEENQNLKKQIEALKGTAAPEAAVAAPVSASPAEPETIVVTTGAEASSAVVRLVQLSTEQAERLVEEAKAEAEQIRSAATTSAQEVTGDAQARAERLRVEADEAAQRVQSEARSRADNLDAEISGRRSELMDGLHAERDGLQAAVAQLRDFEATFRANLANELRAHTAAVESGHAQPSEVPPLAEPTAMSTAGQADAGTGSVTSEDSASSDPAAADTADSPAGESTGSSDSVFPSDDPAHDEAKTSDTPRLDALLGDQR